MGKKTIVFILLIFIFSVFSVPKAYADFDCLTLNIASSPADKAYCQDQLNQIEAELKVLLAQQAEQQKTTGTLKGDVDYLNSQINALKVKIKAQSIIIAQLGADITDKTNTINSLSSKIDREHASLAQLLRNTNEFDNENMINLVLSDDSISSFYSDLESYGSIQQAVKSSVDIINGIKIQTETAKANLQKQKEAQTSAQVALQNAQQSVAKSEADKKQLLAISKQKENAYQQLAAEKKAQADKIRAALFQLRDTKAIPFGTALVYAQDAQAKTAVAPAFLLAIITQESNLGTDSGSCYVTNFKTGQGVSTNSGKSFSKVMNPTRDIPPFMDITQSLGMDPAKTLVSCPIGGYGYGGAMGPAQFIPSTWKLFADRLKAALGYEANPWSPGDAFMASGMYLSDLGAVGTSASAQNRAACKYYGSGLDTKGKYKGISCSYSRSVQALKSTIQANINLL
jgi:membrane-bound lytic murein transglycosylase B